MNSHHKIDLYYKAPKSRKEAPEEAGFLSYCGVDCTKCYKNSECGGCVISEGRPFGGECVIAECCKKKNANDECGCAFVCNCKLKMRVMSEVKKSSITALHVFKFIFETPGFLINIEYKYPDGEVRKPFDDSKVYIWGQYRTPNRERIYSVIADRENIWIADHDENGADAQILEHWKYSSDI